MVRSRAAARVGGRSLVARCGAAALGCGVALRSGGFGLIALERGRRWRTLVWAALLILAVPTCALSDSPPQPGIGSGKPRNIKPFAPGVRIDWGERRVEVDARVVLRKGPLELLACTAGTKEHESILVVQASATHIFQAMGLIGLEAGHPSRFDEPSQKVLPPSGQPLSIQVRFRNKKVATTVPVDRWLLNASTGEPVENLVWVFSGSRVFGDGRLGADSEGTVLCVVDFDTALMAVGAAHSADNEALWVVANPDLIPPMKTRCTLLIGAAASTVTIAIDSSGRLLFEGSPTSVKRVGELLDASKDSTGRLEVVADRGLSEEGLAEAVLRLVRSGIKREAITIERRPSRKSKD